MLKQKIIQLNYQPESWGIVIKDGIITARILWKSMLNEKQYSVFGEDEDIYSECINDFTESQDFTDLGSAYDWLRKNTEYRFQDMTVEDAIKANEEVGNEKES